MCATGDGKAMEFNTDESWEIARQYFGVLGEIPSSFRVATRTLIVDAEKNDGVATHTTSALVQRLLKGPSLKAAVYFAALTYKPEKVKGVGYISEKELMSFFRTDELAALMSLTYLYKRGKRVCDPEEWKFHSEAIQLSVDYGGVLGVAIPAIGLLLGLLAHGMRDLAVSCFLRHDKSSYKQYRRALKSKGLRFDEVAQMQTWGCTDLQVGAVFLQSLGFGIEFSNSYVLGLTPQSEAPNGDTIGRAFSAASLWISSLAKSGNEPSGRIDTKFYPLVEPRAQLLEYAATLRSRGSLYSWLDKNKEDLSPEKTPQLFRGDGAAAKGMPVETEIIEEAAPVSEGDLAEIDSELSRS